MIIILLFFIGHWYFSLFGQTFYMHRYAAHKMFTMNKFWENFFSYFSWIAQGSSYLNARAYAILHRMHHAYSDTKKDPHSPHFFKEVFSMMMYTRVIYNKIVENPASAEEKFSKNLPVHEKMDKVANAWPTRIGFGVAYVIFYIIFAQYWWLYLLLPIHFLMGPIHGAIVNWAGHKYGYRNFNENDQSKNTLAFDFLMLGELFQNNHHHAGARPNFAARWFEFDPVYPILKVFHWLHIIRLNPATTKY